MTDNTNTIEETVVLGEGVNDVGIFHNFAPLYWDVGLPVIPLRKWNSPSKGAGKAPILLQWSTYSDNMPSEAVRNSWVVSYADCNIGLPFGSASGLCAIDIDTEDPELIDAIRDALPASPWVRIGQKGMGLIYKWRDQRNFKLRDQDNNTIVEFLGKGNQMVMPPSIHPKTGMPYVSNCNLWEVLDQVQYAPDDIEQVLRRALGDVLGEKGFSLSQTTRARPLEVIPQGERDIQMIRQAGYLARVVLGVGRDREPLAKVISHMHTWVSEYTDRAAGDDMDPAKGVDKLLEFLTKDVEAGRTLPDGWDEGLTEAQRADSVIAALAERNKAASWDLTKAKAWLVEHASDDPSKMLKKIEELFLEVAKDDNFGALETKSLTNFIHSTMGKDLDLSKPDITRMAKDAATAQEGGNVAADHEEVARGLLEEWGREGEIRFDQGHFWQWSGSCFRAVQDEQEFRRKIAQLVKGNTLVRRDNDYTAVLKTMKMLAMEPLGGDMEIGINFANGFLDSNLELQDHNVKYGKTFTMPFEYQPERASEAHRWFKFLEDSWGEDEDYVEKVAALQEAFAATMFGIAPRYQRAFLLHGDPGTGKTQALEVLTAMMPTDARCSIPPSKWSGPFDLANMAGKTLNLCGELSQHGRINSDVFKLVVEGSEQTSSFKYQNAFEFRPIAAHWFGSNHMPLADETSRGFVRRWLILEFNKVVAPEDRIVNYHEVIIAEERDAIAAWAVQGLPRLLKNNDYTQPKSHLRALQDVRSRNNSVLDWLLSGGRIQMTDSAEDTVDARDCFYEYKNYMQQEAGDRPFNYRVFLPVIKELGCRVEKYLDDAGVRRTMITNVKMLPFGHEMGMK